MITGAMVGLQKLTIAARPRDDWRKHSPMYNISNIVGEMAIERVWLYLAGWGCPSAARDSTKRLL